MLLGHLFFSKMAKVCDNKKYWFTPAFVMVPRAKSKACEHVPTAGTYRL
jgi:hypothetical protein